MENNSSMCVLSLTWPGIEPALRLDQRDISFIAKIANKLTKSWLMAINCLHIVYAITVPVLIFLLLWPNQFWKKSHSSLVNFYLLVISTWIINLYIRSILKSCGQNHIEINIKLIPYKVKCTFKRFISIIVAIKQRE